MEAIRVSTACRGGRAGRPAVVSREEGVRDASDVHVSDRRGGVTGHPSIQPSTSDVSPDTEVCGLASCPDHSQSSPGQASLRQGGAIAPLQPAGPSFSTTHVLMPKTPADDHTSTNRPHHPLRCVLLRPLALAALPMISSPTSHGDRPAALFNDHPCREDQPLSSQPSPAPSLGAQSRPLTMDDSSASRPSRFTLSLPVHPRFERFPPLASLKSYRALLR